MITRRRVVLTGGASLLVAHRLSLGQPAVTIRRIGGLSLGSKATSAVFYAAFKGGMRDLGWTEGKSVEYRIVDADGDVNRLNVLARELIGRS